MFFHRDIKAAVIFVGCLRPLPATADLIFGLVLFADGWTTAPLAVRTQALSVVSASRHEFRYFLDVCWLTTVAVSALVQPYRYPYATAVCLVQWKPEEVVVRCRPRSIFATAPRVMMSLLADLHCYYCCFCCCCSGFGLARNTLWDSLQ